MRELPESQLCKSHCMWTVQDSQGLICDLFYFGLLLRNISGFFHNIEAKRLRKARYFFYQTKKQQTRKHKQNKLKISLIIVINSSFRLQRTNENALQQPEPGNVVVVLKDSSNRIKLGTVKLAV